jgi:hypothetical protein
MAAPAGTVTGNVTTDDKVASAASDLCFTTFTCAGRQVVEDLVPTLTGFEHPVRRVSHPIEQGVDEAKVELDDGLLFDRLADGVRLVQLHRGVLEELRIVVVFRTDPFRLAEQQESGLVRRHPQQLDLLVERLEHGGLGILDVREGMENVRCRLHHLAAARDVRRREGEAGDREGERLPRTRMISWRRPCRLQITRVEIGERVRRRLGRCSRRLSAAPQHGYRIPLESGAVATLPSLPATGGEMGRAGGLGPAVPDATTAAR